MHFYPKKPQILILTNSKVVLFNLEKMEKMKQLSAGTNTYSCMSVHPEGGYIIVGSESQKVSYLFNSVALLRSGSEYQALQDHAVP